MTTNNNNNDENEKKYYCVLPLSNTKHVSVFEDYTDGFPLSSSTYPPFHWPSNEIEQNDLRRKIYFNLPHDRVVEGLIKFKDDKAQWAARYKYVEEIEVLGISPFTLKHIAWVNAVKILHFKIQKPLRLYVEKVLDYHVKDMVCLTGEDFKLRYGYPTNRVNFTCNQIIERVKAKEGDGRRVHYACDRNIYYNLRPFCDCNLSIFLKTVQKMGDGTMFLCYVKGTDKKAKSYSFIERNGHYSFCTQFNKNIYFPLDPVPKIYGFNDNEAVISTHFSPDNADVCVDGEDCACECYNHLVGKVIYDERTGFSKPKLCCVSTSDGDNASTSASAKNALMRI